MSVGMRVALKIAYFGGAFYGHQRQPNVRTVEGECLRALKTAQIVQDPVAAFFRSASRTDRGVSAIGNVIAFDTSLPPDGVVGAFNDRARDVWAWAVADVPDGFHPRHARERWYRYYITEELPVAPLREAAALFEGAHDMRSFTSDPPAGPLRVNRIDVSREENAVVIDLTAPSFRRGLVRRIVAAVIAHAHGEAPLAAIDAALRGERRDFGIAPAEDLVLMDVRYDVPFRPVLVRKARAEWRHLELQANAHLRFLGLLHAASQSPPSG